MFWFVPEKVDKCSYGEYSRDSANDFVFVWLPTMQRDWELRQISSQTLVGQVGQVMCCTARMNGSYRFFQVGRAVWLEDLY